MQVRRRSRKLITRSTNPHEVPSTTGADIDSVQAALSSHPDKVGEDERAAAETKFKAISKAYEILSDDDKREAYDAHGMAAFEKGNPLGAEVDLEDMLAQMFGMGMNGSAGRGPGPRRPRRGEDVEQPYTVTLEELYKGKTTKFAIEKNVICKTCKGSGGKDKAKPKECSACHGRGSYFASKVFFASSNQNRQVCNRVSSPLGQAW